MITTSGYEGISGKKKFQDGFTLKSGMTIIIRVMTDEHNSNFRHI